MLIFLIVITLHNLLLITSHKTVLPLIIEWPKYFTTYWPLELRHLPYHGTDFCIMCRWSLPPRIGTLWHSSPPLCHSENADTDRTGISLGVRKGGDHWARDPGYRVDDDSTPPSRTTAGYMVTVCSHRPGTADDAFRSVINTGTVYYILYLISGDKCGLNFLEFVSQLRKKTSTRKMTDRGLNPVRWMRENDVTHRLQRCSWRWRIFKTTQSQQLIDYGIFWNTNVTCLCMTYGIMKRNELVNKPQNKLKLSMERTTTACYVSHKFLQ